MVINKRSASKLSNSKTGKNMRNKRRRKSNNKERDTEMIQLSQDTHFSTATLQAEVREQQQMKNNGDSIISEDSLDSSMGKDSYSDRDNDNHSESDTLEYDFPKSSYNLKCLDTVCPHPNDIPDSYRTINQILVDRCSDHNYNCDDDVPTHRHREMDIIRQAF